VFNFFSFLIPEYLLKLFENWKLSNEKSVDLCEIRLLRIATNKSSTYRFLLLECN